MNRLGRKSSQSLPPGGCNSSANNDDDSTPTDRLCGSRSSLGSSELPEIPSLAPKRTSSRLVSVRQGRERPRRSRIDNSHIRGSRRGKFAKVDSVDSLEIGIESATFKDDSAGADETLDAYFDIIRKRSDIQRKLRSFNDGDLFIQSSQCAQTIIGSQSVVSGGLTVRTEPAMRPLKTKKKKDSKRDHNRCKGSNSKSSPKGSELQFCERETADLNHMFESSSKLLNGLQAQVRFQSFSAPEERAEKLTCETYAQIHFEKEASLVDRNKGSTSKSSRKVYAQLVFVDGQALVQYSKLPSSDRSNKRNRSAAGDLDANISPVIDKVSLTQKNGLQLDEACGEKRQALPTTNFKVKQLSSTAA